MAEEQAWGGSSAMTDIAGAVGWSQREDDQSSRSPKDVGTRQNAILTNHHAEGRGVLAKANPSSGSRSTEDPPPL